MVCPVDAIRVDDDGVSHVIEEKCVGCGICGKACPFNAIFINPFKKVAEKCDLCADRARRGLPPACVEACPTGAIHFVSGRELLIKKSKNLTKIRMERFTAL